MLFFSQNSIFDVMYLCVELKWNMKWNGLAYMYVCGIVNWTGISEILECNIRSLLSSMHACVCIYALLMYVCAKAPRNNLNY